MSRDKFNGISQMRRTSCIGQDNDPAPFQHAGSCLTHFNGDWRPGRLLAAKENLPGWNGKKTPHGASELSVTSVRGAPGWKFFLDLACILLSLPLWPPLMFLLMVITRIASPGPVFYRQKRVGLDGAHFFIWKFRTMKVSAETQFTKAIFKN